MVRTRPTAPGGVAAMTRALGFMLGKGVWGARFDDPASWGDPEADHGDGREQALLAAIADGAERLGLS